MNDELNLFIFVVIVCCVICIICQIGHEIYLAIIDSKTTSHIEKRRRNRNSNQYRR
ncbi:hypothetical protein [Clostridium perfringens]|uniref:hypothetical protein n=1 Tax=Clostridium perfringens TaxID=1502 RepID=UPI0024BD384B|nr:hypothetical protein [Clostridium perfringens]